MKYTLALSTTVFVLITTPSTPALADGGAAAPERMRVFSATFSPIHLQFPVLEVTGEARLATKVSAAGILGVGKSDDVNLYELGAQLRYYMWGDFDGGLQLGAEVVYVGATSDEVSAVAQGLTLGPFIGYKYVAGFGLTFDAQVGAQYITLRGESGSVTEEDSDIIPLVNLNVGWTF